MNLWNMKLNTTPDCGNAPKRELIKNLTIWFASYELDKAFAFLSDDITWTLVGDVPIQGKEAFRKELDPMRSNRVEELTLSSILSHGKEAAVNGEMQMRDGKRFGFADFYTFTSAKGDKIKEIVSYVVEL